VSKRKIEDWFNVIRQKKLREAKQLVEQSSRIQEKEDRPFPHA
jgi:hypothetical protein